MSFAPILGVPAAVVGMVHLLALPGMPRWGGSVDAALEGAVRDARALQAGGAGGLIVGTGIKRERLLPNPVDPARVRRRAEAARAARAGG